MSYSRCLSLSALLASTFITPVTAMNLTPVSSDNNAILEYTHTYTPVPEPASSFADMSRSYQTAGICFLGVGDCDPNVGFASSGSSSGGNDDYTVDTSNQCLNEGFSKQNCNSLQTIDTPCPYNAAYGKGCKCASNLVSCPAGQVGVGDSCGGQYTSCKCDPALVSCASNQIGQGASCGGKYQSCVCKSEYIYNSSNCTSPRSVSGAGCGGKYTGCSCPSGVSSGSYGCETYYPSPCSSVCKKAYADNCRNRTAVSTPYGCAEYWADCSSKCKTKYNDNCRNRTAANCSYGCQSYWSDCASKCQTCYADNCRNRTAATCSYGCQANWSDCASKCQTCYADNCHNRTAATCSYGCQANWGDCSTKCQTCYADNCRNRTAVSTPHGCAKYWDDCSSKCQIAFGPACEIGDIYYDDGTCVASAYHATDKNVLGIVVHTTDNGKHGQIMAPWPIDTNGNKTSSNSTTMAWGGYTDISSLPNLSHSEASTDYDSCGNTNKIVAQGSASTYPAAWATRKYAPTSTTNGKWCLPAAGILINIQKNRSAISTAVSKVGGASNLLNYWVWSSSERTYYAAWGAYLYHSYLSNGSYKDNTNLYVLPVLEF